MEWRNWLFGVVLLVKTSRSSVRGVVAAACSMCKSILYATIMIQLFDRWIDCMALLFHSYKQSTIILLLSTLTLLVLLLKQNAALRIRYLQVV